MQTIELTLGRLQPEALRAALLAAGVRFNAYAEELLPRVEVGEEQPVEVELTVLSALGWPQGSPLGAVIEGLQADGRMACPLEVAPLLRLALGRTPVGPRLTVLSPRLDADPARPRGFYLSENEGPWLRGFVASDDWVCPAEEHVAVLRRR